jgi:hypothetical protein
LITKADGTKFGKTESGNVWLDPRYTSPYKFYQFWLNVSDDDAAKYIKIFTAIGREEIEALIAEHAEAPHMRTLQKRLAKEVTIMVHSEADYEAAVEAIIEAGCNRILTSGSYDKAIDGIANIGRAVEIAKGRIEIMAGSGVVAANAKQLAEAGVDALHFSAKSTTMGGMKYRNPRISMGGTASVDEFSLRTVDEEEVTKILNIIELC